MALTRNGQQVRYYFTFQVFRSVSNKEIIVQGLFGFCFLKKNKYNVSLGAGDRPENQKAKARSWESTILAENKDMLSE